MNYEIVTLDEISEKIDYGLTTSATSSDTGIKFLRITDIQENGVDWQSVPFCECSEKDLKQYSLARGDIVFARTGATTGKSFLIKDTPEKTVFASYLIRVRSNQKLVDPDFLSCFFQTPEYWQQISDSAVGAAQVGVNGSKLAELKLPLPPLTEQKRIASLLARADRLRKLRRTAHDLGDALLQSMFLEMFGNIAINERNFPKDSMEELCSRVTVGYVGPTSEFYTDSNSGIPFLRTQNVRPILISRDAMQYVTHEFHKKNKKTQIRKDDVLVSRVGVNRGMAAVVPADLDGANCANVLITSPGNKLNSIFLAYLITSPIGQEQLLGISVGSAQGVINTNSLRDWNIAVPPLSLQEEFAGVVARVESLRGRMGESTRQVEGLFESLLSESFGGES